MMAKLLKSLVSRKTLYIRDVGSPVHCFHFLRNQTYDELYFTFIKKFGESFK